MLILFIFSKFHPMINIFQRNLEINFGQFQNGIGIIIFGYYPLALFADVKMFNMVFGIDRSEPIQEKHNHS